ncbi:hypothetical protein [Pontibacter liquoris]|uniref:hypothetical protein n=1 Tax=Pontibacter liquoris TaxID=2905677 RepID=UPI001FA75073|nr:hypothetical protein [Pontibacter liquoris]
MACVVDQTLSFAAPENGFISWLPAPNLEQACPPGTKAGVARMQLHGQVELIRLRWDEKQVHMTLRSATSQLQLQLPKLIPSIIVTARKAGKLESEFRTTMFACLQVEDVNLAITMQ